MKRQLAQNQASGSWRHWCRLAGASNLGPQRAIVLGLMISAVPVLAQLPTPIIDVRFDEAAGTSAVNSGSAGGSLTRSEPAPYWTDNVPMVVGGASSVDFRTTTGNYFVESPTNYPQLAGLAKFTLTGWVNCRSTTMGSGGNRIVTWLPIVSGCHGVDLVYWNNGSLRIGVNQYPDATAGTTNFSSAGMIPTDANAGADNWRFFAVTYDSTLATEHLKFYFGSNASDAALDVAKDYSLGPVGSTTITNLCIGNFNQSIRKSTTWNRMFRGLIDEVKVFGDVLTPEQIILVQRGGETTPAGFASEPVSQTVDEWQSASFSVVVTGTPPLFVQWQRDGSDIEGATGLTYTIPVVAGSDDGAAFRVVVTNRVNQVVSSNAVLTVIPDTTAPTVVAVSSTPTLRDVNHLWVTFSEPVESGSAQQPGNYVLNGGGLATYTAALQPDLVTVRLTIDPLTPLATNTLAIAGVKDLASQANLMSPTNWIFTSPPTNVPPIIEVRFNEGAGTSVVNSGSAGGILTRSEPVPYWTNNVPLVVGGASSVDFGTAYGDYYVESPTNYPQLVGLTEFTIAGWVNCRSSTMGSGGNRIVDWANHVGAERYGVDLVYYNNGSLRIGVNQYPDDTAGTTNYSSAGMIPTDADAGADNWRFFAVTYDSRADSQHLKFYFGSNAQDAMLDVAQDYSRGPLGATITNLAIGNFNRTFRAPARLNRMFRGLIDEVKVFGAVLTPEEIQRVQATGVPAIPPAPKLTAVRAGDQIVISWLSLASFQLQFRHDVAQGIWLSETTAPVVNGNTFTVALPFIGTTRFYRLQSQ